ncbi:MAG: sulfite exporter TauE/SafE family protein [Myxococcales bacterium]|nr:sulfite exporter TauE/SafE family protein [Myxococcales bacterium]
MNHVLLVTAFTAGLVGSTHCLFMCGSLAAVAAGGNAPNAPWQRRLGRALRFQGGRLVAYVTLGLAAGGIGSAVDLAGSAVGVSRVAVLIAGGLMMLSGLSLLLGRAFATTPEPKPGKPSALSRAQHALTRRVGGLLKVLPPSTRAVVLGATTGLLPCGFLWSFVTVAAGTGTPLGGAAVMAAFALGTAPATLGAATVFMEILARLGRNASVAVALALVATGAWTVWQRAKSLESTPTAVASTSEGPAPQAEAPAAMSCCHDEAAK